jgi:glycosyltransferase involved in cell wall biosynthesis
LQTTNAVEEKNDAFIVHNTACENISIPVALNASPTSDSLLPAAGRPKTVVVVPAFREPDGIQLTLSEIRRQMNGAKLLAVVRDDGDDTLNQASALASDTITQMSKGKGRAFTEALRHIRNNGGPPSSVVLIDADGTYPADKIGLMLRILEDNPGVGMVCGNRFAEPNGNDEVSSMNPFYVGNRLLRLAHRILNGINLEDPLTGMRAIRYSMIDGWEPHASGFDLEAELNYRVAALGGSIFEIPVTYRHRIGEKKLRIHHGLGILLRMMRCISIGRIRRKSI